MINEKTCLPVQSMTGFSIAGGGKLTCSEASPAYTANWQNWSLEKKTSGCVSRKAAVTKSWVAATNGSPFLGVQMFWGTLMRLRASARASSV